uniref:Septin 5a n=1 Tax=Seriola dumerili TaxID=41447 RepID=A0A3B4TC48_SERDU
TESYSLISFFFFLSQEKQYVGFATLPNQVHRKSVKKGFDFTLMVAGESGMGKSTLVNSLFLTDLYKDRKLLNAEETCKPVARKNRWPIL